MNRVGLDQMTSRDAFHLQSFCALLLKSQCFSVEQNHFPADLSAVFASCLLSVLRGTITGSKIYHPSNSVSLMAKEI